VALDDAGVSMVEVSIVVPSHGGAQRLPTILGSLGRQTLTDVEMIVVLDGDVDGSADVLRRESGDLPVRLVAFEQNRGRAAALNAGFAAARGEVLVRADDDLELEDDFAEHHLRLHRESRCGVVAMCRDVFPDTPYARVYGVGADERLRAAAFATPPDKTWRWWSGNVSTTRDDYDRVGDYDESFREYGWEDIDWGYRLHLLGVPIVIPRGFTTMHHGPVTSTLERASRAYSSGSAKQRFEAKHGASALGETQAERSAWNALVAATSVAANERSIRTVASVADRTIAHLPPWVAEKAVALLVQASARAGAKVG
jgi:glycosyltransferase involved in cell wall biosynthesis